MTGEQQAKLFMSDISEIPTAEALRIWAKRWAHELRQSPYRDAIREAYEQRIKELAVKDSLTTGGL